MKDNRPRERERERERELKIIIKTEIYERRIEGERMVFFNLSITN